MKIAFLPSDLDAPGCYRMLWPMRHLAERGHKLVIPPHEDMTWPDGSVGWQFSFKPADVSNCDLFVVQMPRDRHWVTDSFHQIRNLGIPIVVEVDDNYLELPEWNPAFYGMHPHRDDHGIIVNREERRATFGVNKNATNKRNRTHLMDAMTQADAVTVTTPYLKQLYSKYNDHIHVIRNSLEWDVWDDVQPQYDVTRDRVRVGYLAAFRYRRGDLEVIRDLIPQFLDEHPHVDFVANTEETHNYLGVPVSRRITVGEYLFNPAGGGVYPVGEKTACLDIGLVPLAPGGLTEGKSHLKGMEYNAAGVPFVSSDSESYRYWCDGLNGLIAHNTQQWLDALHALVSDPKAVQAMGRYGRKKAEAHALHNTIDRWESVYEKIIGPKNRQRARGAIKRGAIQKVSELEQLLDRVEKLKPRVVVEVGSARGGTFWALAQVAHRNALLVSIDVPSGSPLDVRGGKDVYGERDREGMRAHVRKGQRCLLIDGNSQSDETRDKLLDSIGTQPIDVLLIDADHRYAGVSRDYQLYSPLVREGGLIAFHDVTPQNDVRSGVHILWKKLQKEHPNNTETFVGKDSWGLGRWGGVGVLRR